MGYLINVVVRIRHPSGAVVLRDTPAVGAGLLVNSKIHNPQGAFQPTVITGGVRNSQVGLHRVHGGVNTPVILRVSEI